MSGSWRFSNIPYSQKITITDLAVFGDYAKHNYVFSSHPMI